MWNAGWDLGFDSAGEAGCSGAPSSERIPQEGNVTMNICYECRATVSAFGPFCRHCWAPQPNGPKEMHLPTKRKIAPEGGS